MFSKPTVRKYDDDVIIGVMANAIGYVIEGGNGTDEVQITTEKAELYRKAAKRAIEHMVALMDGKVEFERD